MFFDWFFDCFALSSFASNPSTITQEYQGQRLQVDDTLQKLGWNSSSPTPVIKAIPRKDVLQELFFGGLWFRSIDSLDIGQPDLSKIFEIRWKRSAVFWTAHFGYYVQRIIRHPVRKENGSDSTGADGKILVNIIAHGEEMLSVGGIEYRVLMMFDDIWWCLCGELLFPLRFWWDRSIWYILILATLVWCRVYGWRRVVCRGWRSRQDGRNVLDFKMTPTTPFQKALEAWCQHHSMSQDSGALTQIKASHYINLIQILLTTRANHVSPLITSVTFAVLPAPLCCFRRTWSLNFRGHRWYPQWHLKPVDGRAPLVSLKSKLDAKKQVGKWVKISASGRHTHDRKLLVFSLAFGS